MKDPVKVSGFLFLLLFALNLSVRPATGFQTLAARVQDFGAIGDGITDDSAALQNAIDGLPTNAVLDFGGASFTYLISRPLTLHPNSAYTGAATIKMSSSAPVTPIAILAYGQASNVTIDGLTFDGNGVAGGINIDVGGGASIPADNIRITNSTFRNTPARPTGGGEDAIYDPVGILNSVIQGNSFINCGGGILLADAGNLQILNNNFDTITQDDAIYLLFPANPIPYGSQIVVSGNQGKNLARMAVEFWGPGGDAVDGPVISQNIFQQWTSPQFGISVMVGKGARLDSNFLMDGTGSYGIELGAPYSQVTNNVVSGFATGIAVHHGQNSLLGNNLLLNQAGAGILVSNAPGSKSNLTISDNYIQDAQSAGIFTNTSDWGASIVTGNTIVRNIGAWPTDTAWRYSGMSLTPPVTPVTIKNNRVSGSGTALLLGFIYVAFQVNGPSQSNAGTVYDSNTIDTSLGSPFGIGFNGNSQGSMDGVIIKNNSFQNLWKVTGGAPSLQVVVEGNSATNCLTLGPIQLIF